MEDRWYEYWFAAVTGISSVRKLDLRKMVSSARELYEDTSKFQYVISKNDWEKLEESKTAKNWKDAYKIIEETGIYFVTALEKDYPKRLRQLPGMPYALFYKGERCLEERLTVGIVGARRCSAYGESMTLRFAEELAGRGITIISGMAYGVDGIAHRGALNVSGKTCAVLGCGVDVCYPKEHRGLYADIQKQGCILSEFPPGMPPLSRNFPARNRIISGLSDVLLVMEAKEKSGSLITADTALEQGKEVYALPGNIENELSRGCNRLIYQGAGILLGVDELLEDLKINWKFFDEIQGSKNIVKKKVLETKENLVYSCLGLYPKNREEILQETALSPKELLEVLVALELKGYIEERGKNYYIRRK